MYIYETKADLKNATWVNTSSFAKKTDLAKLKSYVEKLDIDKLKNEPTNSRNLKGKVDKLHADKLVSVPVDLSKVSDLVKNDVVKKDASSAKIKKIEDKMPDFTNLVTNASLNAKANEVKDEIPCISNLPTTVTLTTVENEIPNITDQKSKVWWENIRNWK